MVDKESAPTSEEAGAPRFLVGDSSYPLRFRARAPTSSRIHIVVVREPVIIVVPETEKFVMMH
jgi:hypothetical protein